MIVELKEDYIIDLPEEITSEIDIKDGDMVEIYIEDGRIILEPVKK